MAPPRDSWETRRGAHPQGPARSVRGRAGRTGVRLRL